MELLDRIREVMLTLPTMRDFIRYDGWNKLIFGVETGDIITLSPSKIRIIWQVDYQNAIEEMAKKTYFDVPLSELPPVEVDFTGKRFVLQDGHHRYVLAKQQRSKLQCEVTVKANPWKFAGIPDPDQFYLDTHAGVRPRLESFRSFNDKKGSR